MKTCQKCYQDLILIKSIWRSLQLLYVIKIASSFVAVNVELRYAWHAVRIVCGLLPNGVQPQTFWGVPSPLRYATDRYQCWTGISTTAAATNIFLHSCFDHNFLSIGATAFISKSSLIWHETWHVCWFHIFTYKLLPKGIAAEKRPLSPGIIILLCIHSTRALARSLARRRSDGWKA